MGWGLGGGGGGGMGGGRWGGGGGGAPPPFLVEKKKKKQKGKKTPPPPPPPPHEAFVAGRCLASSNQCGANSVTVAPWHTKSRSVASKATFPESYLAVSAWILNGSSIECHKKKRQPFSLSVVRFGRWAILISG